MLSREENEFLTRVGPGTPAGEMLRRYWHPIGFAEELKGRPKRRRILGEDLVLFRDDQGRPGLLALRCSHRGTSLEFGHIEDGGLRCCYHGWLYDVEGKILEMPGEPADSTFWQRLRHPAYKVQELGGVIFAYLGPDPAPLLPRWDVLVREDGVRARRARTVHCNFFQMIENSVDQHHAKWLHRTSSTRKQGSRRLNPASTDGTIRLPGLPEAIRIGLRKKARAPYMTAVRNIWVPQIRASSFCAAYIKNPSRQCKKG